MIYDDLNVVITLRCNAKCRNCIRCCGDNAWTGLDYSGLDMTEEHIERVIASVRAVAARVPDRPLMKSITIAGGEPTLHPRLLDFWHMLAPLKQEGLFEEMWCNVNRTRPVPPEIEPHVCHWYAVGAEKAAIHNAMYVDPAERGESPRFADCTHYRKDRIIVTVQGWTRCCASEGYVRLAGARDLILPELVLPNEWPNQDRICAHCSFGARTQVYERDVGRPISRIYQEWAAERRAGR